MLQRLDENIDGAHNQPEKQAVHNFGMGEHINLKRNHFGEKSQGTKYPKEEHYQEKQVNFRKGLFPLQRKKVFHKLRVHTFDGIQQALVDTYNQRHGTPAYARHNIGRSH